jgi:hypothetical protein
MNTRQWCQAKPLAMNSNSSTSRQSAYDKAMIDNKDILIRAIESAIHRGRFWYRYGGYILAFVIGVASSVAAGFL